MCPLASNWPGMSVQGHPRVQQAKWDTHSEKGRRRTEGGGLFCDMKWYGGPEREFAETQTIWFCMAVQSMACEL